MQINLEGHGRHDENDTIALTNKPKHIDLPIQDQDYDNIPLYGNCMQTWG